MDVTWSAAAEVLAEEVREHGYASAALIASAWRARVDPAATRTLLRAAALLIGAEASQRVLDQVDPCDGLDFYLAGCEEIAGEIAGSAVRATRIARDCWDVLSRALEDARAAAAETRDVSRSLPDPAAQARILELNETRQQAARAAADCEAAMETIHASGTALNTALRMLHAGPQEDLLDAYEPVLEFIADGGVLPRDGDFLDDETPAGFAAP